MFSLPLRFQGALTKWGTVCVNIRQAYSWREHFRLSSWQAVPLSYSVFTEALLTSVSKGKKSHPTCVLSTLNSFQKELHLP